MTALTTDKRPGVRQRQIFNHQFMIRMMMVILMLPVFLVGIPDLSFADTNVSESITASTTWTVSGSPYIVTANVTIRNNAKLTIDPGVVIKFNAGVGLTIGSGSGSWGTLSAVGEQGNHIVFTSNVSPQNPGDWRGIYFSSNTGGNTQLNYCTIEYGGNTNNANLYLASSTSGFSIGDTTTGDVIVRKSSGHGIYLYHSNPVISNCRIMDNQSDGIYCENGESSSYTMTIADNLFEDNVGAAVSTAGYINTITGSQGSGNGEDGILVRASNIRGSCTWSAQDLPFVVQGNVNIYSNAKLTITPGAIIKFNAGKGLTIGSGSGSWGTLLAVGEQDDHIIFTSNVSPQNHGDWKGIYFSSNTGSDTQLNYCTIEYGGNTNNANLYLASSTSGFSIGDTTTGDVIVRKSSGHGIYLYHSNPVISNCQIMDNQSDGIYCDNGEGSTAYTTTIADNLFEDNVGAAVSTAGFINTITGSQGSGNGEDGILVRASNIRGSCTWSAQDLPFVVQGNVNIYSNAKLTITPGAIIKFNAGKGLTIGSGTGSWGSLLAVGEQDDHIIFTSNVSPQSHGDWKGIYFSSNTGSDTQLNYCTIEYGGNTNNANLYLASSTSGFSIGDTTTGDVIVRKSSGHGIYLYHSNPVISNCQIMDNQSDGIYCDNGEGSTAYTTTIADNLFEDNVGAAVSTAGFINTITGSQGSGNGEDGILVRASNIRGSCTWSAQDLPFVVQGNVNIYSNAKLTITPGAIIKFNAGKGLTIGSGTGSWGSLLAVGEQDDHIIFTSNVSPQRHGDWKGIYFSSNTGSDTQLNYCTIEYGGHTNNANLYLNNTAPTIQNNVIRAGSHSGIYANGNGCDNAVIKCNNIIENLYGIYTKNGAQPVISQNNLMNNSGYGVYNDTTGLNDPTGSIVSAESNWWEDNGTDTNGTDRVNADNPLASVSPCVDTPPPLVTNITPADNTFFKLADAPSTVEVSFIEYADGLDTADSVYTITDRNDDPVNGSWDTSGNPWVFTRPFNTPFVESAYTVTIQLADIAGNLSPIYKSHFEVDNTPPPVPGVDPVTSPTNSITQTVTGTKEAYDAIYLNDSPAVSHTSGTIWEYQVTLEEGSNSLVFKAVDRVGNESDPAEAVEIFYDDTVPAQIIGLNADGNGDGTTVGLSWTYDEGAQGSDIIRYDVYQSEPVESTCATDVSEMAPIADVQPGNFAYTVTGLTRETAYCFAVVPVDANEQFDTSVNAASATPVDVGAPAEATNLTVSVCGTNSLTFDWTPSTSIDFEEHQVSFDGGLFDEDAVPPYQVTGLTPASSFTFKIIAVDGDGNQSNGIQINAATLVDNPAIQTADSHDGYVTLTWTAPTVNDSDPVSPIKRYAIYKSTAASAPASISEMTWALNTTATSAQVTGLTNGQDYYFAVATVNISGYKDDIISAFGPVMPMADIIPPEIGTIKYDGADFTSGGQISESGAFELTASDASGISRVEFTVLDGSATVVQATDYSSVYTCNIDLLAPDIENKTYTLEVTVYDTIGNTATTDYNFVVALPAPDAPVFTSPSNGYATNQSVVTVKGTAEPLSTITFYVNGTAQQETAITGATGNFSGNATLPVEGTNNVKARAANRAGQSVDSNTISVILNTDIPDAPMHLTATPLEDGKARLTWNCAASDLSGYNVYRHTAPFDAISGTIKVNAVPVTTLQFLDTPDEGLYYYRITSVNSLGTKSALSNQVEVQTDDTDPEALEITYTPQGPVNPDNGAFGPGRVDVTLVVSEPLLTTPFFSMVPDGGVLIPVDLTKLSDTEYTGYFIIEPGTISGETYAVFSARDKVGNRGTYVPTEYQSILVDARGPEVVRLDVFPAVPIDNNNPVMITAVFGLDEPVAQSGEDDYPVFEWALSGAPETFYPTNVPDEIVPPQSDDVQTWQVTFTLPALAVSADYEDLFFSFAGIDALGNVGDIIIADNAFEVYQGDLPALERPDGLNATALPAGQIELTWDAVENASGYRIYRGTTTGSLAEIDEVASGITTYTDQPGTDGDYYYAVTSLRTENEETGESDQRILAQSVNSDSVIPVQPTLLPLTLTPNGIQVDWSFTGTDQVTFSLYRAAGEISSVTGLQPVRQGIPLNMNSIIDPNPSLTEHNYVIVAVDAAGNLSTPSNNEYLDPGLLPVTSIDIVQEDLSDPVITWTTTGTIAGCNIYLGEEPNKQPLNAALITTNTYTDTGYAEDQRTYTVTTENASGVESLDRVITLPLVTAAMAESARIDRGIMNGLNYTVSNHSGGDIDNIRLKVDVVLNDDVTVKSHQSLPISLAAGESRDVAVIIGGYENLPDLAEITTTIEITEDDNETIRIVRNGRIDVGDGLLGLRLTTETFTRGGEGAARFSLENTCAEEIEIVSARNSGDDPSDEIVLTLEDEDGLPVATQNFQCATGSMVVTLTDGTSVVRIPPGETFESDPIVLPVTANVPDNLTAILSIAHIYFHLNRDDQVIMGEMRTSKPVTLTETSYIGEVTSVTPANATGDTDITISGRAVERGTEANPVLLSGVPLTVVISNNGFERTAEVYTDDNGLFEYLFTPTTGDAGTFQVCAVHPDLTERPVQDTFVISRVNLQYSSYKLTVPRGNGHTVTIAATAGSATTATNLRFEVDGTLPSGVTVICGDPITISDESGQVSFTVEGDSPADVEFTLRLVSDESPAGGWTTLDVELSLVDSRPSLWVTPDFIQAGLNAGSTATESVTLENKGYADMEGLILSVINTDAVGSQAPEWIYIASSTQISAIAPGDTSKVDIVLSPPADFTPDILSFYLKITSLNHATVKVPFSVTVTTDVTGRVLFHVSDIYTGTLDEYNEPIYGLANARILLQNEATGDDETLTTDAQGEAMSQELPVGSYRYRVRSDNHQELAGRVWVKPGITRAHEVFLPNQLVTVEWEVVETTIADKYEIIYNATFETNVPAAVVVADPAVINIPDDMNTGDVMNGEITLTNHGLIRADEVGLNDVSNKYFQVEYIGVPESILPHQVVTVPYRITCLMKPGADEGQDGTGGKQCCAHNKICGEGDYTFECANGVVTEASFESCAEWDVCVEYDPATQTCVIVPTDNPPGLDKAKELIEQDFEEFMDELMPDGDTAALCAPPANCSDPDGESCIKKMDFTRKHRFVITGSGVDLLNQTYNRDDTDLSIQVPGGLFKLTRKYSDKKWDWGLSRYDLELEYAGELVDSIDKDGIKYEKSSVVVPGTLAMFTNNSFKIIQQMDGTFVWQSRFGDYKIYDEQGRLTEVGDAKGPQRHLIYNGDYLAGLADKNNQQYLWLDHDTAGRIIRISDDYDREVLYTYTPEGWLETVVSVSDTGESRMIYGYGYDAEGKLTNVWLPANKQINIATDDPTYTITYNDFNMVKSVTDINGESKQFGYNYFEDRKEYYASVSDTSGQIKESWFDADGDTRRVDINGETQFRVEKEGRITRIIQNGHTTTRYEDEWGNRIKEVYPDGSFITRQYERDLNRLIRETDENGIVTAYTYDSQGNRASKTEAVGTTEERTTQYVYNNGHLIETRILGTSDIVTTMTYDPDGNQTSITTDAEGEAVTTRFIHDIMGNVLTKTVENPDGDDLVWTYTYDAMGNLLTAEDPEHKVTRYEYDFGGRKTKQIAPDLTETLFEYDMLGNMIKQTVVMDPADASKDIITTFEYGFDNKLVKMIDSEGAITEYAYDSRGRRVKTIDPAGNEIVTEYDPVSSEGGCTSCGGTADQPISVTYPTFEKAFVYDERNRKIAEQVIVPEGETLETRFVYDPAGNLIEKTDKDNQITYYEYDALNRLVRVTDPNQGQTAYAYDNRDNMTSLTDAQGNTTAFAYDGNNRLAKETRPEGEITTYDYDLMGNLIEKIDAKDQKTEYDYNNAGQLDETRYYDASLTLVKTVSFTYDDAGNLDGYNDGTTSAVYVYDNAGRKTSETVTYGSYSWTNTYTHLKNGLKKTFTGPDNVTYTYMYDTANRLAGVQMPAGIGFLTVNGYNWNRPAGFTLPGGGARAFEYDPLMRIKQIIGKDPGGNDLLNYDYTYDTMDNITSKATEHGDYGYEYDALHRLTDVDNPEAAGLTDEEFTYDNVGNRLTTEDSTSDWDYNFNNELQSSSDSTGDAVYEYDDNGNTIKKTVAGVVTNYVYNVEDRLTEVRDDSNNLIASYYYDPFGRRLSKTVGSTTTYYHYSDEGLVAEIDSYGNVDKTYGWQPGGTWGTDPLFMRESGTYFFYHNDHLGTPQKLTSSNGAVVWSAKYSSFGEATVEVDTVENNLRFPGQYYDEETGLHYNMWRYYDPETGRYLRVDPVDSDKGSSIFAYASNNSINNIDSLGLCEAGYCDRWRLTIVSVIGATIETGGVVINAELRADPERCCIQGSDYQYVGIGIGFSFKNVPTFIVSGDGQWFDTPCISLKEHVGFGRATSWGVGVRSSYGHLWVNTPQAYLRFKGWSKGLDLGAMTTTGHWSLKEGTNYS